MLIGKVRRTRDGLEPSLRLGLFDFEKGVREFDFVVDTGFTGYMAINRQMLRQLGLTTSGVQRSILADGQVGRCDVVVARVIWDGAERIFEAQVFDGDPLIGTRLLDGYDLRISMNENGVVEIAKSKSSNPH